ncbi:hypothetical protein VTN77DRAFT_2799 [Rasamsonia byssochlamydoides]|uniref:uncharacterized protein n=1 Tax=Rasamsonia byssochlamydoides TaxID=89139 RepID=UPI00374258C2
MTILILGGSKAKTSIRLASLLSTHNVPFVLASRSISDSCPYPQALFDWMDEKTYGEPFAAAENKKINAQDDNDDSAISAVYIVPPPVTNMVPPMKAFIDFAAREKRVKRFVLLSASSLERGGPAMGQVHDYLATLATERGLEYAVLRPTWFMENFSEGHHQQTIKNENKIYSAAQDGKIPFVSADDIAAVAYRALVDEKSHDTDHVVLGPELLSYDDVAAILSDVLGRKTTHVHLPEDQLAARLVSRLPEDHAAMLAAMDTAIAHGAENRLNDTVEKVTGRAPRRFRDFAIEKKQAWL